MTAPAAEAAVAPVSQEVMLSVIVVNWKVRDFLRDCLRSLYEQTRLPREQWELLVVDNDSNDGSVEMLRAEFPGAAVLVNARNVGFARANNQAFARCSGKYIVLLNPDTVVLDGAMDRMLAMMESQPRIGALGCRLLNNDGSFQRWTGGSPPNLWNITCHFLLIYRLLPEAVLPSPLYLESEPPEDTDVGWVSGACMCLRREALAGELFDERFFLYGEDLELCDRLARAGWGVVYTPRASIVHHEGRSVAQQTKDVKVTKLRSLRDIFSRRHGPVALFYYDVVVVTGFLLRALIYGVAAPIAPGRGFKAEAAVRRRYLAEACRALMHRS
jgi:N-acetylglucosaminyl-diphospho-decaprenol L-rhamnosyltransferase